MYYSNVLLEIYLSYIGNRNQDEICATVLNCGKTGIWACVLLNKLWILKHIFKTHDLSSVVSPMPQKPDLIYESDHEIFKYLQTLHMPDNIQMKDVPDNIKKNVKPNKRNTRRIAHLVQTFQYHFEKGSIFHMIIFTNCVLTLRSYFHHVLEYEYGTVEAALEAKNINGLTAVEALSKSPSHYLMQNFLYNINPRPATEIDFTGLHVSEYMRHFFRICQHNILCPNWVQIMHSTFNKELLFCENNLKNSKHMIKVQIGEYLPTKLYERILLTKKMTKLNLTEKKLKKLLRYAKDLYDFELMYCMKQLYPEFYPKNPLKFLNRIPDSGIKFDAIGHTKIRNIKSWIVYFLSDYHDRYVDSKHSLGLKKVRFYHEQGQCGTLNNLPSVAFNNILTCLDHKSLFNFGQLLDNTYDKPITSSIEVM